MSLPHADDRDLKKLYDMVREDLKRKVRSVAMGYVMSDDPVVLATLNILQIDRKIFLGDILREIAEELTNG